VIFKSWKIDLAAPADRTMIAHDDDSDKTLAFAAGFARIILLAGAAMRCAITFTLGLITVLILAGCTTDKSRPITFFGLPETETSGRGPVGLINGQSYRINDVTAVSETTYDQYQLAKRAGRIFTEETHGDCVYYAIKERRDARFDNASAWVEVTERFKARKP
jgi:hypothetical protein